MRVAGVIVVVFIAAVNTGTVDEDDKIYEVRNKHRVFEVDYEHDQFLKDGSPFRYIAGSLHYFRVPRAYWQDRLRKLRAAGLNAVSTYVEWSLHEPKQGQYDFTGEKDLEHFIRLAEQECLLVILRPGPYICAERDLGGYPPWIFHENPNVTLRTNDSDHTTHVDKWLRTLLPKLQPLLYGNGGPVIMVQVENEYGSYPLCETPYKTWLRDLFRQYIGDKALLFTTDGSASYFLKCGPIPGIFITVDFGTGKNLSREFRPLRQIQPHGPLVNSEFYPGWLTHWGENRASVDTEDVKNSTRDLLAFNASLNFYIFAGGTNFGFTSGANNPEFAPQLTSYDYDAPITESGDLTDKYFAIKDVISEFAPVPNITVHNTTKMSYETLQLDVKIALFDSNTSNSYGTWKYPQTFEALELYSGFMLYETTLPPNFPGIGYLQAAGIHDRTIVYIDKSPVALLSRSDRIFSVELRARAGQTLSLLVENQGHINYGYMLDLKGITQNVTLNGKMLTNWKHTGYPLNNVSHIAGLPSVNSVRLPAFFSTNFQLPETLETPLDTFVHMAGWSKGVLFVNGHNLGRYWPKKGPQVTLYLPGIFLLKYPEYNTVVILELEREHPFRSVSFTDTPIWIDVK